MQRPSLSHAAIAEAGVRIADTRGIAAVSMRRLADELGVSAMACYAHYERYVHASRARDEHDRFQFGLECLLDGIAIRIDREREPPRTYAGAADDAGVV